MKSFTNIKVTAHEFKINVWTEVNTDNKSTQTVKSFKTKEEVLKYINDEVLLHL